MSIVWLLIKASWINVAIAIIAGIVSGGCNAKLIALINTAIEQGASTALLFPFAGFMLLALVASSIAQFILIDLAQNSVYQMRLTFSRRILAAPLQQLEQLGPSQLLAVLTKDIQTISQAMFIIPVISIDIAVIFGCLIYLGWLSGWVFLAVVVFMLVAMLLVQVLVRQSYRFLLLAREETDRLFKHFRSITDGVKELKLHSPRRQAFFEDDLQVSVAASRSYQKSSYKLVALATSGGQLLFFGLIALLLFGLPQIFSTTQAVLPAYILTLTYLQGPLKNVIQLLPNLANASVSIQKVNNMGLTLGKKAEIDTVVQHNRASKWQQLDLRQVAYTYQSDDMQHHFTVGPLDLSLKVGEIVFIVGGNGSGKSTLAKLIMGLYSPDSGELRLDGQPVVEANLEWYRQHFSAVFSDFYLFERLASSRPPGLDSQTQKYLEKLELDRKVSVQDGELSTLALSQGQRKRLALLTAYIEDRPIYVFDEWAADQDPVFREVFYTQLLAELKQRGKTVLVISHDDHFFHVADRIIKLDYGHIESDSYVTRQPMVDC